jgi:hypothetical protein
MLEQLLLIGALLFLSVFVVATAELLNWIFRRLSRIRRAEK